MADLLIPIGAHFFTPEALQKVVAAAEADHPGKANVLAGTVDSSGASVVLALGAADGRWMVKTAFSHDWSGNSTFGAGGSVAW
jgi:hypothetical protein